MRRDYRIYIYVFGYRDGFYIRKRVRFFNPSELGLHGVLFCIVSSARVRKNGYRIKIFLIL